MDTRSQIPADGLESAAKNVAATSAADMAALTDGQMVCAVMAIRGAKGDTPQARMDSAIETLHLMGAAK